jgi:hypothetical protein
VLTKLTIVALTQNLQSEDMVNYGQLYVCVSEGIRVKYIYLGSF